LTIGKTRKSFTPEITTLDGEDRNKRGELERDNEVDDHRAEKANEELNQKADYDTKNANDNFDKRSKGNTKNRDDNLDLDLVDAGETIDTAASLDDDRDDRDKEADNNGNVKNRTRSGLALRGSEVNDDLNAHDNVCDLLVVVGRARWVAAKLLARSLQVAVQLSEDRGHAGRACLQRIRLRSWGGCGDGRGDGAERQGSKSRDLHEGEHIEL